MPTLSESVVSEIYENRKQTNGEKMSYLEMPEEVLAFKHRLDAAIENINKIIEEAPDGVTRENLYMAKTPNRWSPSTGECGFVDFHEFPYSLRFDNYD